MMVAGQQESPVSSPGSLWPAICMEFVIHAKGFSLRGLVPDFDGMIHVGQVREVQRLRGKTDQDSHRYSGMVVGTRDL